MDSGICTHLRRLEVERIIDESSSGEAATSLWLRCAMLLQRATDHVVVQ